MKKLGSIGSKTVLEALLRSQTVGGAKVSFWRKLIENQSCDEY